MDDIIGQGAGVQDDIIIIILDDMNSPRMEILDADSDSRSNGSPVQLSPNDHWGRCRGAQVPMVAKRNLRCPFGC